MVKTMFGTLQIKSRPLRLGMLVDLGNKTSLKKAIEINSTIWGGYYNPLIPIFNRIPQQWEVNLRNPRKSPEVFRGYIKAFDPDVLINCGVEIPEFVNSVGLAVVASSGIWENAESNHLRPAWAIGVFDLLRFIFDKHFRFVEKFPHQVKTVSIPRKYSLFWAAAFGCMPDSLEHLIIKYFGKALDVGSEKASTSLLSRFRHDSNILYPHRITRFALKTTPKSMMLDNSNLFFMDATSALDLMDYWNLRAAGRSVIPIPRQFKDDQILQAAAVDFLKSANYPMWQNPDFEVMGTFIRSRTVTMEEMEAYSHELRTRNSHLKMSLQHWYPRMWDDWGREKDRIEQVRVHFEEKETDLPEGGNRIRFKTLLPGFLEPFGMSDEPRYANDIQPNVYGYGEHLASVFPAMPGKHVMRAISEFGSLEEEWRIGRDSLVKLVKYDLTVNWSLPLGEEVFYAWLRDMGWIPEASPPGLVAKQMFDQLHGWVVWFNEKALHFLEEMSSGKRSNRGAAISEIRNRLAMPKPGLGDVLPGEHLFNQLLERNVFVVGYQNQCPRCFKHSWYSVKDLDSILECPRCLHTYRADQHILKGSWRYKTSGPFSIEGYADGAYCVLASINFFGHKLHHLALTSSMSFKATKQSVDEIEADFGLLWRESNIKGQSQGVIFGECKSFGEFKVEDFKRMAKIAKEFPGAVLVFSTFRKKLSIREKKEIAKIAKRGRKRWKPDRPINPVCVLTGHELMNHIGPPYCWKSLEVKPEHKRIIGLMEFCNATQQIHLDLPSWVVDWQNEMGRDRQRRLLKL